MSEEIKWGISKDLQADIRYEPNACKGYVMDISLGCPNHCIYCLFSPLELLAYKLQHPEYKGDVLLLKLDKFLAREEFPPAVYMCYSSDALGNAEMVESTIKVLKKLFDHNVNVLLISKSIFTEQVLDIIKQRPDLMNVQVGLTSRDVDRNELVEPGAPSYEKRIENLGKLAAIDGLGSLGVRIDPMLPFVDDTEENIGGLLDDVHSLGVKEAIMGYVILTRSMREAMKKNEFLKKAGEALTEKTDTISGKELFSFPFQEKKEKFDYFNEMCCNRGMKMAVCACKDIRLKSTSLEWICHPFNRKRRVEFEQNMEGEFKLEYDHLG